MQNIISSILKIAETVSMTPEEEKDLIRELKQGLDEALDSGFRTDEPYDVEDVSWSWDKGQRGGMTDPSWDPYIDEINYDMPKKWIINWDDFSISSDIDITDLDMPERIAIMNKVLASFHSVVLDDVVFHFDKLGKQECKVTITHAEATQKGIEVKFDVKVDEEDLTERAEKRDREY
jgi:hypothetical protein